MKNRHFLKVTLIIFSALLLGFIDLPTEIQEKFLGKTQPVTNTEAVTNFPDSLKQALFNNKFRLGLDLQGGSQLDYLIDLRKVPEKDQKMVTDGVLNVINTRVNSLGVSEPNIYIASAKPETHLIVELAGIKDLEEAKRIVGKTIQLEFKEQRVTADPNAGEVIKKSADDFLAKVTKGGDMSVLGKEEQQSNPEKITYTESTDFQFKDDIADKKLADALSSLKPGEVYSKVLEASGDYIADETGNVTQSTGFNVVKLLEKQEQEKTVDHKKEVKVSHILIAFKGATDAEATITRTEAEAKKIAEEIIQKIQKGDKFEDLAKTYSDDQSNKEKGGVLDDPAGKGNYIKEFEDASLLFKKAGEISPAVKSPFGFHIIKANAVKEAYTEKKMEPQFKYAKVFFNSTPSPWQDTGLTGQQFTHADVEFSPTYQPYITIQFNDEGSKLFEEITGRNIGKPIAIFVGGQLISAPTVNLKIAGGKAQITGSYTVEEATALARDLNTGAIPAPITLSGQNTIGASLGQDALTKSLGAAVIGFILVALFMILYYRLPGLLAVVALSMYSVLMLFLIKTGLPLFWSLAIAIVIFGFLVAKILNARDSGPEKAISLILACFILFFLTLLLNTPIVMTLAGIAGVVLSIGMAVDANILIFERVKEELRDGRPLSAAIEVGFDRAWSSIRDSNFSSLLTCTILFYFGSSVIQGFAFNLAAGILVSMFTAITITKTLIAALANTRLAENLWLFGAPKKKDKKLWPVIQMRKTTYIISASLLIIALAGIPIFGMRLGLDFTGGTLLELKFDKKVSIEELQKALEISAKNVNDQIAKGLIKTPTETQALLTTPATEKNTVLTTTQEKIDMGQAHIVPSEQGYIIKTKHISTEAHDLLLPELEKQLGTFQEARFTTVGPTVGESLRYRAIIAVIIASLMIVLYIAFAFRKIPRHIGKWRFGVAAIVALLHDLGIMIGVYVYLGVFFGVEIDALFITALLTILGFSVHDTIVVFDRIREKIKFQTRDESFADVTNQAVNETIGRSINTSLAVFLTLLALALFGAESIRFFVITLIVGIVAGTYSSIFVASPLLVDWYQHESKQGKESKKKK